MTPDPSIVIRTTSTKRVQEPRNVALIVRGHRRLPIAHHFEAALRGARNDSSPAPLFSRPSVPPSAG